ncbi:MAG: CCA tRNA nucleotidyltransferase [Anaerolineae bacterium]|nr:CCA tRNA nucleotidyltransferase [Anaerolineae bacterium]
MNLRSPSSFIPHLSSFTMIDLTPYAGRWVALVGDVVAGVGHTPEEAKRLAQHNRPKERPFLHFIEAPDGQPLHLSPLLTTLRPFFLNLDQPVYLVGGAVRDAVRGVENHDLDFVVPQNAIALTFKIANQLGEPAYVLDRERDAGRVVLQEAQTMLDFTCFRGDNLLADLADRDFTINAMALPATAVTTASIIDPFNGLTDLAQKQIRLVQPNALEKDPVRALRAVRQGLSYGFHLTTGTKTAVTAAAPSLHKTSNERMRDELIKLLETAVPDQAIQQMAELGLLSQLLPEIADLAAVEQSPPHHEPVLAHTISVLRWLVAVETAVVRQQPLSQPELTAIQPQFSEFSDSLQTHLDREIGGGLNGRLLLYLDGLFHDVGKKESQTIDESGRIRFLGHDAAGAALAGARLRTLAFSNQAIKQVETAVAHHMRPLQLAQTGKVPSRRAIYRYFLATQETGLDIGLLSLADHLATFDGIGDETQWHNLITVILELFRHYFEQYEETVAPEPLINGRDLIKTLKIPAGPEIGRILRLVQEAQAAGELTTRDEALEFANACRQ